MQYAWILYLFKKQLWSKAVNMLTGMFVCLSVFLPSMRSDLMLSVYKSFDYGLRLMDLGFCSLL